MNGLRGQYAGKVKFETMDLANFKAVQPYQQQYAVKYAPTVLVLDPSGKAVYNESPNTYGAELTQKIQAALDQVSKQ